MTMMRPLVLLLFPVLAGCGNVEPVPGEVAKLKGQTVAMATGALGNPSAQEPGSGGTTYVWTNEVNVVGAPIRVSETSYASGRPQTSDTMAISPVPLRKTCTLRAMADSAGVILSAVATGDNAACAEFARKL
jgi:hypothetical protein